MCKGAGSLTARTLFRYLFIYLAVPGLKCGMRDLVPWPGIEPEAPCLGCAVLDAGPPGKFLQENFIQQFCVSTQVVQLN